MSLMRSEYRKLGLELVSLEDNLSLMPKKPSMVEEKKNDGADDSINLLLEQSSHATEGRNDGEFFPHPSMPVDRNKCIFIKQPLWKHLSF
jgi:hypothetical protein